MRSIALTLVSALLATSFAVAQGPPAPQPTEQHKLLQKDVGKWTAVMKMYMQGPDGPPEVMDCTEVNTMMENDMWMISEFRSGPFHGRGQFGYDPIKKKYVGTWIDNMSPHMGIMSGDYNQESNEMVMYSTSINPQTQQPEKTKSTTKYVGDDAKDFVMYRQDGDNWVKSFEISYKRSK